LRSGDLNVDMMGCRGGKGGAETVWTGVGRSIELVLNGDWCVASTDRWRESTNQGDCSNAEIENRSGINGASRKIESSGRAGPAVDGGDELATDLCEDGVEVDASNAGDGALGTGSTGVG
jgi:hypothetical protein